jgi:hypothetical protein
VSPCFIFYMQYGVRVYALLMFSPCYLLYTGQHATYNEVILGFFINTCTLFFIGCWGGGNDYFTIHWLETFRYWFIDYRNRSTSTRYSDIHEKTWVRKIIINIIHPPTIQIHTQTFCIVKRFSLFHRWFSYCCLVMSNDKKYQRIL